MNLLDLFILLFAILAGVNGFRRGAALQLTAYAGLIGGLLAGALLAPVLADLVDSSFAQAMVALSTLLVLAAIGDGLGWFIGSRFWAIARRSSFRAFDSAIGSIVAVAAVLLTVWFLGVNLANGPVPGLARQIRGSQVVRTLDHALPRPPSLISGVRKFLNRFDFPEVFEGLPPAPAGPVKGPSRGQAAAAADQAMDSTVRILGEACDVIQEGSGFVAASNYVVTNAHVIAGVTSPQVQQHNGGSQPATPVLFDPKLDIAVLRIGTNLAPPLALTDSNESRGAAGAVLGYPGGGGLEFQPAAVRRELDAIGKDIYGESTVRRNVYELQTVVRPGNSGGPFVLTNGDVAGVVMAASTTDPRIGYAVTSPEVIPLVEAAQGRTQRVSTGPCNR
ncbi:MAG TPA: MarP family serine protease [Actinomycetota bacterium]|nr:MarP family serine protease [Actinomycetota bacterium]